MNNMQERVRKAIIQRGKGRYRNQDDAMFCVDDLGYQYPLAEYKECHHGPDWAVYIFHEPVRSLPVWAVSIDLPEGWATFDIPMETAPEVVRQYDRRVIFTLSGKHCTEDMFKRCIYHVLTSVTTEEDV